MPTPDHRLSGGCMLAVVTVCLVGLSGCPSGQRPAIVGPSPSASATATPMPTPTPSPAVVVSSGHLDGLWLYNDHNGQTQATTASGSEAPAGPVEVCGGGHHLYTYQWRVAQSGSALTMTSEYLPPGGAYLDYVTETVSGTQNGNEIRLGGFFQNKLDADGNYRENPPKVPVAYVLTFQPDSQHLVGTRNGQPYWTAPLIQAGDCGPPIP